MILLAVLLLASMAAPQPQPDPCEVRPDLPGCPPPPEAPGPAPEPVAPTGGFEVPAWVAWALGALFGLLFVLKQFDILGRILAWWDARADDRVRYGHPHKDHHGRKGKG